MANPLKNFVLLAFMALLASCAPTRDQAGDVVRRAAEMPLSDAHVALIATAARQSGCVVRYQSQDVAFMDRFGNEVSGIRSLGVLFARGQIAYIREPVLGFAVHSGLCPGSQQDAVVAAAQANLIQDMQVFLRAGQIACAAPVSDFDMENALVEAGLSDVRARRVMTVAVAGDAATLDPGLNLQMAPTYCGGR